MKIIKDNMPSATSEAKTLQYYFDGKEWCQTWERKTEAHDVSNENYLQELEIIRQQVLEGKRSPLYFHLYKNLFDINLLASYTGIAKRHIKKHLKPEKFNQLDEVTLKKYAAAFNISVEDLKRVQI